MKVVLVLIGLTVAAVIAAVWTSHLLLNGLGGQNEMRDRVDVESPDHRYVATGYHIIGGATVADMTIVVVHAKDQSFEDPKNDSVFIADNLSPFRLVWTQSKTLQVTCSLEGVDSKKDSWNDVAVQYVEK